MFNEIILIILALISAILSTVFGIAAGLLLLPFAATFIPIKEAVAFVTIYFMASNINKIILFWKHIDWKTSKLIYIGSIPFTVLGAFLLYYSPSIFLKKFLGFLILLYVINEFYSLTKKIKLNSTGIIGISTVYGFIGGIIGAGGVIKAALLNHLGLSKEKFVGTMAVTALVVNIIKTSVYSRFNLINIEDIPFLLMLIVMAIIGGHIGKYLLKKIDTKAFRKGLIISLSIISLYLIIF